MAKKILSRETENWLMDHFSEMTNKELAEHLNKMLEKENRKQQEELKNILKDVTHPQTRDTILNNIEKLQKFKGIDATYVRHVAKRIGCPPKSGEHISNCNRLKAKATKFKYWSEHAQFVDSYMKWFRSFRVREVRYCKVKSYQDFAVVRSTISTWNKLEGEDCDIKLKAFYEKEILVIKVQALRYRKFK